MFQILNKERIVFVMNVYELMILFFGIILNIKISIDIPMENQVNESYFILRLVRY